MPASGRTQSSAEFLALSHHFDTQRWALTLSSKVSGGRGSLFGRVGLAAGIVALEHATNKPVVWATGQYPSLTQLDERLDLEVILPAIGRNVVQGRVVGHVGNREIITVCSAPWAIDRPPQKVAGNPSLHHHLTNAQ